jgi:hypothetical protein
MSQPDAMPRIWRVLGDKRGDTALVEARLDPVYRYAATANADKPAE